MRVLTCFFLTLCLSGQLYTVSAQEAEDNRTTPEIDSLFEILNEELRDTNAVNIYHDIASNFRIIGNQRKAFENLGKGLEISRELNWHRGIAKCYTVNAQVFLSIAEYDSSEYYFQKAIDLCKEHNLQSVLGTVYMNYSNLHSEKGAYAKANELLLNAFVIFESRGDQLRTAGALVNLGVINIYQNNFDSALSFYEEAEVIYKDLGEEDKLSTISSNKGTVAAYKGDFSKSLSYFKEAARVKKRIQDLYNLSIAYQNIAEISNHLSQFDDDSILSFPNISMHASPSNLQGSLRDSAKLYLNKGIIVARKINSEFNIVSGYSTLGSIHRIEGNFSMAAKVYRRGLSKARDLELRQNELDFYKDLFITYEQKKQFDSAFFYHKEYSQLKDTIFSKANQKAIGKREAEYIFEKEKAVKEAEYQSQLALDKAKIKRQRLYQSLMGVIILAVVAVSLVIYRALRGSRRQRREIEDQKQLIEKKNLEILSSIRYASRIQNALLKEEEKVSSYLPDHFVYYLPREIVSGDFYWSVKKDDCWYLAVADCTGHGVPGGFLTMLGTAYLNEIISTTEEISPSTILDQLRTKIVNQLRQSEDIEDSKDGMDISLISLNLKTLKAKWAGAHNPIYFIGAITDSESIAFEEGDSILKEIKGDKQPIGFHSRQTPFKEHEIQFHKGDSFYLLSDGFPDQFGGPNNKKYRYKPLKKFILNINSKSPEDQKIAFQQEFESWRGNEEQLDDVCVIGVKL